MVSEVSAIAVARIIFRFLGSGLIASFWLKYDKLPNNGRTTHDFGNWFLSWAEALLISRSPGKKTKTSPSVSLNALNISSRMPISREASLARGRFK